MSFVTVVLSGVGLLFLLFFFLQVWLNIAGRRMILQLPWRTWLTYEQVREMGHSEFLCKVVLPVYYKHGYLEVRILPDIGEEDAYYAENLGFCSLTIDWFEFRLTKRGGRRRISLSEMLTVPVRILQPARN